jgi:tight adherence protein B
MPVELLLSPVAIAALVGLSILLLFLGLSRARRSRERAIEERLGTFGLREVGPDQIPADQAQKPGRLAGLDQAMEGSSFAANLATQLARADLKLTPAEFVLISLTSMVGFFLLTTLIFRTPVLGLVGGIVGFFAPRWYVGYRHRKRLTAFNDQLGDTINLLANSLRSGYSIIQAMETVAHELADPMATEFSRVVQEIGLGLSHEQALSNLLRRINSEDLDLMVTAIVIQSRVGGNLAQILDTIGFTIRERVRIKGEIRVLTAQQMISAHVLTGLPIILGLFLFLVSRRYMMLLFQEPCGWIMVITVLVMITAGYVMVRRIIDIEV